MTESLSTISSLLGSGPSVDPSAFAKRVVLVSLQTFFSKIPEFRFSYKDSQSEIRIADQYAINLEFVENNPAIGIIRSSNQWRNIGIDRFSGQGGVSTRSRYHDIQDVRVQCNCYARNGIRAERLAGMVFNFFTYFRPILRRIEHVFEVDAPAMGSELLSRTDSDIVISLVPVQVSLSVDAQWAVAEDGELMRNLDITPSIIEERLKFEDVTPEC